MENGQNAQPVDYASILSESWDNVPEEKQLPSGTYGLRVIGANLQPSKKEGVSPQVVVVYEVSEPLDDVSDADLEALGEDYDFSLNVIYSRYWFGSPRDKSRVKQMLLRHGVDPKGLTLEESLKALKNTDVVGFITTRNYTDSLGNPGIENIVLNVSVPA